MICVAKALLSKEKGQNAPTGRPSDGSGAASPVLCVCVGMGFTDTRKPDTGDAQVFHTHK